MEQRDRVKCKVRNSVPTRPIDAEAVNDRAKLMMHRLVARRLAADPGLIQCARDALARSSGGGQKLGCTLEWARLLALDFGLLRRRLTERSDEMKRLRISSPFATVAGLQEPTLRRRIWRKARQGMVVRV